MNLSQNHYAQFYMTNEFLVERVERYVSLGLTHEAGVIVVATPEINLLLKKALEKSFVLHDLARKGQLVIKDANEALALFMVDGRPDPKKFEDSIGTLIKEMSQKYSLVRAYGEMVNVLWEQQNRRAAFELEDLWTKLACKHNFSLLCGYSMKNFAAENLTTEFGEVCNCHSHVYPDETYAAAAGDTDQYRRLIAELQQRNLALQNECTARKDLEAELFILKKQR